MSFILPSCESTQEMDATDDIYDLQNTLKPDNGSLYSDMVLCGENDVQIRVNEVYREKEIHSYR